jgi:flavin reductase (DIM6/NTAB) family NADH-FMN oxidoreductase RutF
MEKTTQDVLDKFHYGIYLITITAEDSHNGMIASWVTQCSHEPPLVVVAIRNNRLSHSQVISSRKFTINVLSEEGLDSVKRFKIPDWRKKFNGIGFELSPMGNPVLHEALGYLDCEVERTIDTGDHTLFIARIKAGRLNRHGDALSTDEYGGVYRGNK